jgi:hypothetical protein
MPMKNSPFCSFSWYRSRAAIVGAVLACFAGIAQAGSIEVDLGPAHTITTQTPGSFFADLDGTALDGESLAVDFSFSNNEFGRIFTVTSSDFQASVKLQTNDLNFAGFLDGTGYLVDADGNAIPGYGVTGSASGSDGWMAISLFPLLKDDDGTPNDDLQRPLDFYGVHFDLTFPDIDDPSIFVTSGEFWLSSPIGVFGVGPGIPRDVVPDSGGTLLLFAVGLVFSIGFGTALSSGRRRAVTPGC